MFNKGDKVTVIADTCGHGQKLGEVFTIKSISHVYDKPRYYVEEVEYYFKAEDFEIKQATKAALLEKIESLHVNLGEITEKLFFMCESGLEVFDENKFKAHKLLKLVEQLTSENKTLNEILEEVAKVIK